MQDDRQMLCGAIAGSRDDLARIAERYVGFVYNTSLRLARGDSHLAEDITQAVFVVLAQKIHHLRPDTVLVAWLFRTTRYVASNAVRMRSRRQRHERRAAELRSEAAAPGDQENSINLLLDDALSSLRERDRCAVMLSYFSGRTFREVAEAIGSTEAAARKRVERAIGRMRAYFEQSGVTVGAGAVVATLAGAGATSASAAAAPPILASTIASNLKHASATTNRLAKVAIDMMTWAKFKVAAVFTASVLGTVAAVGAGAVMLNRHSNATSAEEKASAPLVAQLKGDLRVEFHGISDGQQWWMPDGSPGARVDVPHPDAQMPTTHFLVVKITGQHAEDAGERIELRPTGGVQNTTPGNMPDTRAIAFVAPAGAKSVNLRVALATGEWQTIAQRPGDRGMYVTSAVIFSEPSGREEDDETRMSITDDLLDHETRILVFGTDGTEHVLTAASSGITRRARQSAIVIPLSLDKIEHIEFQARPYDQVVEFRHISLVAGQNQGHKLESGPIERKPPQDDSQR